MRQWREYYAIEVSNDGAYWADAGREHNLSSRRAILESTEVLEASQYRMVRVVVRLEAEHFRGAKIPPPEPGDEPDPDTDKEMAA